MTRDTNIVKESLSALVDRLNKNESSCAELRDLLLRLNSQFPGDVGCFCIYFMNHITLEPGQAMFLAPNLPHAYLDGGKAYGHISHDLGVTIWGQLFKAGSALTLG